MNLVDASNIERNLYLTTQLLEMGIPVVIALNMMDIVKKRGDVIDVKKLSQELGVPVVETAAIKGEGTKELVEAAKEGGKGRQCTRKACVRGYHRERRHRDREADRGCYRAGAAPLVRCQAVRARQQGAGALHPRQGRAGQDREAHHRR